MPYNKVCTYCGARLDPQESCDCLYKCTTESEVAPLQRKRLQAKHGTYPNILHSYAPKVKTINLANQKDFGKVRDTRWTWLEKQTEYVEQCERQQRNTLII